MGFRTREATVEDMHMVRLDNPMFCYSCKTEMNHLEGRKHRCPRCKVVFVDEV